MNIGILGTGDVGRALAVGLSAGDHDVVLGSREPETVQGDGIEVVDQRSAAAESDAVILAVPGEVAADVATDLREELAGKVVVDTTNEYPTPADDDPIAVRVAEAAPDARVVKAFNTIGANRMHSPVIDGIPATMFLAGDDSDAVRTVSQLAAELGFDPVLAGDLEAAAHLEHLARFWIDLSREYGRDIGFRLLQDIE